MDHKPEDWTPPQARDIGVGRQQHYHFNESFINLGISLARNINKTQIEPLMYVQQNRNNINIPDINGIEINSVISSRLNSSAGYDEVPASIIKQLLNYYAEPLHI